MVGPRGGRLDPGQTQSLAYAFLEVEPSKPALVRGWSANSAQGSGRLTAPVRVAVADLAA